MCIGAAIRLCRRKGVCPDLKLNPQVNSIALTKREHIDIHKEPDDESFGKLVIKFIT